MAKGAQLSASVDRTQLSQDEHILFTLELINSDTRLRAEGVNPNVDLSLLSENFDLSRPVANNRYNIYQGRGRSSSTLSVQLFPRKRGHFTIPSFSIDGEHSKPIHIEVKATDKSTPPEIFVRSGVNKTTTWVNEQLVAYIDLYHRVELGDASMGDTLLTEPVDIDTLPHWKLDQEKRTEQYQEYEYSVQRIAWALFPQSQGKLTVQLPDLWVTTVTDSKEEDKQTDRRRRLSHQQINVEVKPLPEGVPENIIIGRPEVSQTPPSEHATQNQLSHWRIQVKAPVAVITLPKYLPGIELPDGLKLYADAAQRETKLSSSGIVDQADYLLSIMPLKAGEFELPQIRIPYFEPDRGEADYIELSGPTLSVKAAELPQAENHIALTPIANSGTNKVTGTLNLWIITSAIFATLWLTTLLAWRITLNKQRTFNEDESYPTKPNTLKRDERPLLQQRLLKALDARTLEEGLNSWLTEHPDDTAVRNAVIALQDYYYSGKKPLLQVGELETKVSQALTIINQTITTEDAKTVSRWNPKTFSPTN